MKTAMQEMILNIEAIEAITTDQEQIYMLTALKMGALVFLKKEKEQIIDAYNDGYFADSYNYEDLNEYYNQTYNQNK